MADDFNSLTDDWQREQRERQENVRLQIANQQQKDPSRSQRVMSVGAVTGLPYEVVDADLDNLEKLSVQKGFDVEKWRKEAPEWASFASDNPFHLSVFQEDLENMGMLERAWAPIAGGKVSSWAQQEMGMIGDRQRHGDTREGDEEKLKNLRKYSVDHDFGTTGFHSLVVATAKQSANFVGAWKRGLQTAVITAPAGALYAGAAASPTGPGVVPSMIAGYGAGFTAGMIGGGFSYTESLEGGHAYLEYKDMGFSHEDAAWAANIAGNLNGVLEVLGGNLIFNRLPGADKLMGTFSDSLVKNLLTKPTFRAAVTKGVKDVGIGTFGEITTEIGQEVSTIVMGEILKRQNDRDDFITADEAIDRISDIAVETLKSTILLAGAGPTVRFLGDSKRAYKAKQMEQVYKALGEGSEGSETLKNVPSKYREFVERLTKDGPLKSLLIDIDRFTEYFQEIGQDPEQVAKELGIDLEAARVAGVDLEIPIDSYAEKIAPTEHHAALARDLKADRDDMTAREAEEYFKTSNE